MDEVPKSHSARRPSMEVDVYKHVVDVGLTALKDQLSELDGIRARTVQFLAFVGTATAFLVGTSLRSTSDARDSIFNVAGVTASAGIAIMLMLCISILTGAHHWWGGKTMTWDFQDDPAVYIEWLDGDDSVRPKSDVVFYRYRAKRIAEQLQSNDKYLASVRKRYIVFLVAGIAVLAAWGVLAWRYGGAVS